jgi:hypothetical protein
LRLAREVSFQALGPGQETVILSLSYGWLYTCNDTTAEFLRRLDGRRSLAEVIEELLKLFAVSPESLTRDMTALAEKLLAEKLLVEQD